MRKIFTTLLLLVCGSGAFAQYMSSGVVSQGTLINNRTEIIRSGFDIWVGGGVGFGGVGKSFSTSYNMDAVVGYNVTPKMFLGAGIDMCRTYTDIYTLYVDMKVFDSRNPNTLYGDFRLGKIVGGSIYKEIYEEGEGRYKQTNTRYHKPNGAAFGVSLGYLWNHFALEYGLDVIFTKELDMYGNDLGDISEKDWERDEYAEYCTVSASLDAFIKVSYRF